MRVLLGALLTSCILFSAVFFNHEVQATSSSVIKLSPVRRDIEIKAGEQAKVQVTATNLSSSPITFQLIENDFIAGDEEGRPSLILDDKAYAPTHSLKRFMKPIGNLTIAAGKSQVVDVVIEVPSDAQAGGYYGAVRLVPLGSSGGQVSLTASAATLILVTVPGDMVEKMNLTNFDIQQHDATGNNFGSPNDIGLLIRFENKGNVQTGPFGKITLKRGGTTVYTEDFNSKLPRDVILPDTARRWKVPLRELGDFGYYTVFATFTYGSSNKTTSVSQSFWILPHNLIMLTILVLIVLLALVVGGALLLIRKRRNQKHRHRSDRGFGIRR